MKRFFHSFFITIILLCSHSIFAKQFYRFKNNEGNVIVKDQVSNEMIANGYDVISETGQLIEQVPPGKTLAETEKERLKELEKKQEELALRRRIRDDAELLRQFSSIGDIIRNRDAQLLALEQRIKIQASKSDLLKLQLEDQQRQAATHERLSQPIPKLLTEDMKTTRAQIKDNVINSELLEKEKVTVADRYEKDIIRYKELESLRKTIKKQDSRNDGSKAVTYDCPNRNICNKAWQVAQIYAKDNASGQIEIITNALIVTSRPEEDLDLGLSFSRLPSKGNEEQIVFEVTCSDTEKGAALCRGDIVKNLRANFLKTVKRRID